MEEFGFEPVDDFDLLSAQHSAEEILLQEIEADDGVSEAFFDTIAGAAASGIISR